MKAFNIAASTALGAVILMSSAAQAAEPPTLVHHDETQDMAHFLPDWRRTMDTQACSKDGHKIHVAFRIYPAVNHLNQAAQRLGSAEGAHQSIGGAAYRSLKSMWQLLAGRQTAQELTESVEKLRALPEYTRLMRGVLESAHRKTNISLFAEAIEVDDNGPCGP